MLRFHVTIPPLVAGEMALLERLAAGEWAQDRLGPTDLDAEEYPALLRLLRLGIAGVTFTACVEARRYYLTPLGARAALRLMGATDVADWRRRDTRIPGPLGVWRDAR